LMPRLMFDKEGMDLDDRLTCTFLVLVLLSPRLYTHLFAME